MVNSYGQIDACALTPDQLTHYVAAISGMEPRLLAGLPFYVSDGHGILVCFNNLGNDCRKSALNEALSTPGLKTIAVLDIEKPEVAPDCASISQDYYWSLPVPPKPSPKTKNMLKRAAREIKITVSDDASALTEKHEKLVRDFCSFRRNSLDEGTVFIFTHLAAYVASSANVKVFSAWREEQLAGFVIGDFSSFEHAFYMFAFRSREAPPGTADLLLNALIVEAKNLGFAKINLGLGINDGVEFFKKKWGAEKYFPYVETSWNLPKKGGFFTNLKKIFSKK